MTMKTAQRITAWSFSRWWTYQTCPYQAKLKYIDKIGKPFAGPAAERGTEIHQLGEDYLLKKLPRPPAEYGKFKPQLKELRQLKADAEKEWAFTRAWERTTWFASNTWLRVKVDAVALADDTATVVDFKTGKVYDHHMLQMDLYAVAAMIQIPVAKRVRTALWYVDQGKGEEETFPRTSLTKLKKSWEKKAAPMLADTKFKPTPSEACRRCEFSAAKGGPCKYS